MDKLHRWIGHKSIPQLTVSLLALVYLWAAILDQLGLVDLPLISLLAIAVSFVAVCYIGNSLFSRIAKAGINPASYIITALVLAVAFSPTSPISQFQNIFLAGVLAIASKYIFRRQRHIFNPAIFGLVALYFINQTEPYWWIAQPPLLPIVLLGGIVLAYKLRRLAVSAAFIIFYLAFFIIFNSVGLTWSDNQLLIQGILLNTPLLLFALLIINDPATSPNHRTVQLLFSLIIALLAVLIERYLADLPIALEAALLIGNLFSWITERSNSSRLILENKTPLTSEITRFDFEAEPPFDYQAGQYIEIILPHHEADDRGQRRWFTLSSSPTESQLSITTRFIPDQSSSFKQALFNLPEQTSLQFVEAEGDFTLVDDATQPLVFIAGGIGLTPFRSMIKYILDVNDARDIILLHVVSKLEDFIYQDVINEATEAFGLKYVQVCRSAPADFAGYVGELTPEIIKKEVPTLAKQVFYVSGPEPMVEAVSSMLAALGVPQPQIKQDFFPGYTAKG